MKIQFEVKEKLPEIIAEVRHSDKWQTKVVEKTHSLERVTIKDPNYDSEACVEIWDMRFISVRHGLIIPTVFLNGAILVGVNISELIGDCWNRHCFLR